MRSLYAALAGRETVREVAELLGQEDIGIVPLKGALLYALGCTDPWTRAMVDVDVLVRRRDFEPAVAALLRAGWAEGTRSRSAAALWKRDQPLLLDLHHRLYNYRRFGPDVAGIWRRARPDTEAFGAPVWRMDTLDLYAHLVGHFAKERLDERQSERLVDLARVASRCELDPSRTAAHLEAEGLGRAARYTLGIAHEGGDGFAGEVCSGLAPDPLGELLARLARRAVAARPQPSRSTEIASALLDRSLLVGARSLAAHARDVVARMASG